MRKYRNLEASDHGRDEWYYECIDQLLETGVLLYTVPKMCECACAFIALSHAINDPWFSCTRAYFFPTKHHTQTRIISIYDLKFS